jgi:trimeric autotransporter adhesin
MISLYTSVGTLRWRGGYMQRVSPVRVLAALAAVLCLSLLLACGGGNSVNTTVSQLVLSPTTFSMNEGAVATLAVSAENSAGTIVPADITFSSSNNAVATVSTGGLICAGQWDSVFINCTPTNGTAGVGQVTITAASGNITSTATVYVHEQVDQVQAVLGASCTTMGLPVNISGQAYSTTAPGCSPSAPCNITSTVGPFTFGSNDTTIVASSSGIVTTFNSATNTPTYSSGGTITGSTGQTCDLSNFNGVNGATATVALTSQNTIASGTKLTITNAGSGGTTPPTTATLTNGTATCSGTANVATSLSNGVLTAGVPGATTVFASVSGVNSVGTSYLTCPVATIMVTNANSSQTSFTLNPTATQGLTADVYDTMGQYITPTLTWGSSSTAAATVSATGSASNPGTITAVAAGTAYITASCSYPDCNRFVPAQYSQNVVTATITGTTSTSVYAASTNSLMLVPFNISTDSPGTAITLPEYPNSIIADPAGLAVYLGSAAGLMTVNVASGTVTSYAVNGTIEAITPDGQFLLISDSAGAIRYFDIATGTLASSQGGYVTSSSAYTPDSKFNEFVTGTNLGVGLQTAFSGVIALPVTANALDISAQGGLTYITSASGREIDILSTCNQSQNQVLTANAPTLIAKLPNGTGAVAADSPAIDVVTTPSTYNSGCPVTTQSTVASYDLGAGSFTAQQIFVSSDSTRAWVVTNLPQVLTFDVPTLTPTAITLAGNPTPYNGGVTLDGTHVYVGTSDGTVHRIDTASLADVTQIAVGLKDASGNITPPNLVSVVP